jgi:cellobiose phosphorylase
VTTESSFARDYITHSTDGQADLSVDFTATWLLSVWPELTHLFALAMARMGLPDKALQAVQGQLPAAINRRNPLAPAFYYPEKYIFPFDLPWLCTWAGDPTYIEVLLGGFFGVKAGLDDLTISPRLPSGWGARGVSARFMWRGASVDLRVSGTGDRVAGMTVNGIDAATIDASFARQGSLQIDLVMSG